MKAERGNIDYGMISIVLSNLALTILFIQLFLGWKHGDGFLRYLFFLGFPVGILFAILGILFGLRDSKGTKKSMAIKGIYLGIGYFIFLILSFVLISIIFSGALH